MVVVNYQHDKIRFAIITHSSSVNVKLIFLFSYSDEFYLLTRTGHSFIDVAKELPLLVVHFRACLCILEEIAKIIKGIKIGKVFVWLS